METAMVAVGPGTDIDDLSDQKMEISKTAKDVVRRNTEEVQGRGNWALFDERFADNFFDHTPQPGGTRDKAGVLVLYQRLREAFPDFTPEIHWQRVDGDVVTTFKTIMARIGGISLASRALCSSFPPDQGHHRSLWSRLAPRDQV
jgi:hypothetical protein